MLPFDPATIGTMLVLAASGGPTCQMPQPAAINVKPSAKAVKYDYSQTMQQMQATQIDTINPYGFDSMSHTSGYMKGRIIMRPSVKINYEHLPKYGAVCLWYESIDLKIHIEPTIVIAKEIAQDKCRLAAVKEHELKHVRVDRQIVNKYGSSMGQKIYQGLQQRGFLVGPVRQENAQQIATRMQQTVGQLVELEYKKMEIERAERQQAVDSLEEYQRVSSMCDKKGIGASRNRR